MQRVLHVWRRLALIVGRALRQSRPGSRKRTAGIATSSRALGLQERINRYWEARPAQPHTAFELHDFEKEMWRLELRMGPTPFAHHQGIMKLLGLP